VSNNGDSTVSVIDGNDLTAPPTVISGFNGPDRFAVDESSAAVYVGNNPAAANNTPSTISLVTSNPLQNIQVPGNPPAANNVSAPTEMAYVPSTGTVYAALQNAAQVAYFSVQS
jgi:DNA-binding beta-propeller fold protein YncE